jgi:ubiquinone/menaquinone biosynthesis C-methylase UbiE
VTERETEAAREHFDRWAPTYERDRAARRLREAQTTALAALNLQAQDVFLDLGCGTGAAVRDGAGAVKRAVGIDLSPGMIAEARTLSNGLRNAEFVLGDVSQDRLPFEDQEFTALLCSTAFHHFPQPSRTIGEMARVLAPGGRLVIADANADQLVVRLLDAVLRRFQPSHVGFRRPSRLVGELQAVGFQGTSVTTIWMGGYAIVRAVRAG